MNTKLTSRRQRFVTEYVQCWNASEAARRAGYKERANNAGRFALSNPVVRAAIEAELRKHHMGADEVLSRLETMARGNIRYFTTPDGDIDLTKDEAQEHSYLLKRVKVTNGRTKSGEPWRATEIELHDPQAALVHVGRYWALFTDKTEHSGEVKVDYRVGKTENDLAILEGLGDLGAKMQESGLDVTEIQEIVTKAAKLLEKGQSAN